MQRGPTDHLKRVPQPKSLREKLRELAAAAVAQFDPLRGVERPELEAIARRLLAELRLPEGFVGWTMVMLASAIWQPQVMAVPPEQRLLLLPADLPHAVNCSAEPGQGSVCECSACEAFRLRAAAEKLGYRVLWAEESAAAVQALAGGEIEAVVGVASLDLLENALDQILRFDVPCLAVPLLEPALEAKGNGAHGRKNGSAADSAALFDADWVRRMIELPYVTDAATEPTPNYRRLVRAARRMFEPDELERLAPRSRGGQTLAQLNGQGAAALEPIAATEAIAFDFLCKGGKYSRPFITLAVYDALTGGEWAQAGIRQPPELPLSVRRAALSIETFHKASLVHDDIEDDDPFRYGEPTLHHKYGVPTAINVGDYLIGLGYRLVSRERGALGAEVVGDILDHLADAHLKLSEGQGAELLWRDARHKQLTPAEALAIYALKTAPAFEAALLTGLRLAGPIEAYVQPIGQFARHLGVAFQIRNDLCDWQADDHNKLIAAGDVLGGRPTLLWALACEQLTGANRARLESLAARKPATATTVRQIRRLYQSAGVFDKAEQFVGQYEEQARSVADTVGPAPLRRLLHYLIDVVLAAGKR